MSVSLPEGDMFDVEWYLENYIISEQMENYRMNSFWYHWLHRGLFAALAGDARFIAGWEILDSEGRF